MQSTTTGNDDGEALLNILYAGGMKSITRGGGAWEQCRACMTLVQDNTPFFFCQKRALAFLSECSAYEDNTKGKLSEKSLLNGIMENIEQGPAR